MTSQMPSGKEAYSIMQKIVGKRGLLKDCRIDGDAGERVTFEHKGRRYDKMMYVEERARMMALWSTNSLDAHREHMIQKMDEDKHFGLAEAELTAVDSARMERNR